MISSPINAIPNFGMGDITKTKSTDSDFGSMLQGAAQEFVSQQKSAETNSAQAVSGKGNLVDVMTSVTNAETSLQMLVSIRDKFVQAYQEISRTPV